MKNKDKIIDYFDNQADGSVIAANQLYVEQFSKMTESAFFKALERLVQSGYLVRVAKGMYSKNIESDEQAMLNYYFGEDNSKGMYIGSKLYAKYSIAKDTSDTIELYSNAISKDTAKVGSIYVKRVNIELSFDNTKVIEALEILQNYAKIENLDKHRFAMYAKQYALSYNDEAAVHVVNNMHYKKSTIAFMKKILDMYKVDNSMQQFLSFASRYNVPAVQRIAR